MIKATMKELKNSAEFLSRAELVDYLKRSNAKIVGDYPKILAYCETVYGVGGYLLLYVLDNYQTVKAFTGRSNWLYTCQNFRELGNEFYIECSYLKF